MAAKVNDLFFALSDKTRREILEILKNGDLTAGEIADHFQITKPSLTHHLNILNQADLVDKERDGQFIRYSLNTTVLQQALGWIMNFADRS